jgi:hypothetical protein
VFFRPSVVFVKDRSFRLFLLHARHADLFPMKGVLLRRDCSAVPLAPRLNDFQQARGW